ncbi:hypothetical protein QR680_012494 [Steinernema hermaphroditum]|uniref:Uncharacterized protein n=1 Tax=Steinernema hermaphroditum TaxID=289476 RepID=A0AA39M0U5_9BILA|nr:hypothetical protein QR680_012494 [Steinernema hermaphroditum]
MGQSLSRSQHKNNTEQANGSVNEVLSTPVQKDYRKLDVDPRSPTVEISRTPIEVDNTTKGAAEEQRSSATPARFQQKELRRNVMERNMLKEAQG